MTDFLTEFQSAMQDKGFEPVKPIVADDKWHGARFNGERGGKISGTYSLKIEGNGAVGCFFTRKDPDNKHAWSSKSTEKLTPFERKALQEKARAHRIAKDKAEEKRQRRLSDLLTAAYKRLPAAVEHPYLTKKGIKAHGIKLRVKGNELIIPLRGTDGKIWTLQRILADGSKFLFSGGRKKGSYFAFASAKEKLDLFILCEGYATGSSIRDATGLPVIGAIDSGNLKPVIIGLKSKYPTARFIIAADNDQFTKNTKGESWNVGIEKAKEAAAAIGYAHVIHPTFPADRLDTRPTDFNDLAAISGLDEVKRQISEFIKAIPTATAAGEIGGMCNASEEDVNQPHTADDYLPAPDMAGNWEPDYSYADQPEIKKTDWPFKCLGHDHGQYFFLAEGTNQIIMLKPSAFTPYNLYSLADRTWWFKNFPKNSDEGKTTKIDFDSAADEILRRCHDAGVFHADDRQRGCGVWAEKNGPLIHCGDKVIYKNEEYSAFQFESHFIYEGAPQRFKVAQTPLTTKESRILYDICNGASWKDDKSGKILAGWIVASIIGGCLKWRPHIWIMGERGSGKSWIISDVLTKAFGRLAFFLGAGSTEAGIRQSLQHDCLPVIMDEMEGESLRDSEILQSIITMSRRSSSGQRMTKGTSEGIAQSFTLQSAFCFASINHSIAHGADQSRISILESQKDERDPAIFMALDDLAKKTLTPEYSERLLRRVIDDLPYILKNITTFQAAVREKMKDARASQQLAPLLAGVFSLTNGGLITPTAAKKWLDNNDFKAYTAVETQKDCERAWDFLMTSRVKITGSHKTFDVQIGKAISTALGDSDEEGFTAKEARSALDAIDIKVRDYIWIRRPSQHISRIFKSTPWAISWIDTLKMNEFVSPSENVNRIGSGLSKVLIIDTNNFREQKTMTLADEVEIPL